MLAVEGRARAIGPMLENVTNPDPRYARHRRQIIRQGLMFVGVAVFAGSVVILIQGLLSL
jgi:hypothetical protein